MIREISGRKATQLLQRVKYARVKYWILLNISLDIYAINKKKEEAKI